MLLQGPVGPFFRELGLQFVQRGFDVLKVNFNGGDLLFSSRTCAFNFKGSPLEWAAWLNAFVAQRKPAAIILFGDGRPYHIEALHIAAERQVTAWCLEEGYVRPDYITCERGGNNARSPLRQSSTEQSDRSLKAAISVKNPFGMMAVYAAFHIVSQTVLAALFPRNVRHRNRPIIAECAYWMLNVARKAAYYAVNRRLFGQILSGRLHSYYVVALQVHDDLSLLRNGNGWTMERLIEETVQSFAYHAPQSHQLLFKVHPLDRGHLPYRKLVTRAARANRCESRVKIVDDCPIGPMIRRSEGLITVNSTSGLIALQHGKPMLALGNAVYSCAILKTLPPTSPAGLHLFWWQPIAACRKDVREYLVRMRRESLVNGSFYLAPYRSRACNAIADRVQRDFASKELSQLLTMVRQHHHRINGAEHELVAG